MYRILAWIFRLLIGWKLDIKVEGLENLPKRGPALIVFNHNDELDVLAMMFSIPRTMYAFVAHKYRFNPIIAQFNLIGNVILIKRGEKDKRAMQKGLNVLKKRRFLVIAPEGTRGTPGVLGEPKYGAAYLAGITKSVVVPVGIQGTAGSFVKLLRVLFKKDKIPMIVKIGVPFYLKVREDLILKHLESPGVKDRWLRITREQIMPKLAELLPKSMRGKF